MARMHCERYHCDLEETICVKRQLIASGKARGSVTGLLKEDLGCSNCEQGRNVAAKIGDEIMKKETTEVEITRKPGIPETIAEKICEKCNKRPTINKFSKYCSPCLNSFKKDKPKKTTPCKPTPEKARKTANDEVGIEFGRYVSVLRGVEKLAEREMRPVNLQIIYMLKSYLDSKEPTDEKQATA